MTKKNNIPDVKQNDIDVEARQQYSVFSRGKDLLQPIQTFREKL